MLQQTQNDSVAFYNALIYDGAVSFQPETNPRNKFCGGCPYLYPDSNAASGLELAGRGCSELME